VLGVGRRSSLSCKKIEVGFLETESQAGWKVNINRLESEYQQRHVI